MLPSLADKDVYFSLSDDKLLTLKQSSSLSPPLHLSFYLFLFDVYIYNNMYRPHVTINQNHISEHTHTHTYSIFFQGMNMVFGREIVYGCHLNWPLRLKYAAGNNG